MLPTFQDFIKNNPQYKNYLNSADAESVYNYLLQPENIKLMIDENDKGEPALKGIQAELEAKFNGLSTFNFKYNIIKQCVGIMIKDILSEFGYIADTKKPLSKTKIFKSEMHYNFDESKAKRKLVYKLVIV